MDPQELSIKPCPFCGNQIILVPTLLQLGDKALAYYWSCSGCHIESSISMSKEQTIKHANSRCVYIKLLDAPVQNTVEVRPGIFKDISYCGNIVGVEEVT